MPQDTEDIAVQISIIAAQVAALQNSLLSHEDIASEDFADFTLPNPDYDPKNLDQYDPQFIQNAFDPTNFTSTDEYEFVLLGSQASGKTIIRLEPFTVGWVVAMIAAGVLSWIGSKVMEDTFGDGKINFQKFMVDVIKRLALLIRQELLLDALREYVADLETLEVDINHFNNAPSEGRLDFATSGASKIVSRLKSLALMGYDAYAIAVGLHIAVLQERVKFYKATTVKGKGEQRNIMDVIDRAVNHLNDMNVEWETWHSNRYSITPSGILRWNVKFDGVIVTTIFGSVDIARQYVQIHKGTTWPKVKEERIDPIMAAASKWKKLGKQIKEELK